MKYTFATPNPESSDRCGKPNTVTVEADTEEAARELVMLHRWGPPKLKMGNLGIQRWTGQGLVKEESK